METISFFTLIHILFWWKFYKNPWKLCTSEVASNFFPYWYWFGKQLKSLRFPLNDSIYYRFGASIPFLSTFYPPWILSSLLGAFLCKKKAFKTYVYTILLHSLLTSIGVYWVVAQYFPKDIAVFASISMTYNAYMIRPQTPCASFTLAWIPLCLVKGWVGMVAFGMAVLGGYWPYLLVSFPFLLLNPECFIGGVLALPQVIPFLRYYPKSIRVKKKVDPAWGRMPLKRFFFQLRWPENGMIHYPEYSFGVGVCLPLAFLGLIHPNIWHFFMVLGFIGSQGWILIDRIPARFVFLISFSTVMASLSSLGYFLNNDFLIPLLTLQGFLLWKNRDIYPSFPFSQWWKKITEHKFEGTSWPNNTGYMNGIGHQSYFGGFSLAENYHE